MLLYSGVTHPRGLNTLVFDKYKGLPPGLAGIIDALETDPYINETRKVHHHVLQSYDRSLLTLEKKGYVRRDEGGWRLTDRGRDAARVVEGWFLRLRAEYLDWAELYSRVERMHEYEKKKG